MSRGERGRVERARPHRRAVLAAWLREDELDPAPPPLRANRSSSTLYTCALRNGEDKLDPAIADASSSSTTLYTCALRNGEALSAVCELLTLGNLSAAHAMMVRLSGTLELPLGYIFF